MEHISGYARILARARVEQQLSKTFLGKPYLKYGQCYALWAYFFQLGGIMGAKHASNPDGFALAFLGMEGEPGAVVRAFTDVANHLMMNSVNDSTKFEDLVSADMMVRVGYTGDAKTFIYDHGATKIKTGTAAEVAWQYARDGAALGTIHPRVVRQMFERTHAAIPKERWDRARAAGVDIPPVQDVTTYEEVERDEDGLFMAYCQECCPSLYSILFA